MFEKFFSKPILSEDKPNYSTLDKLSGRDTTTPRNKYLYKHLKNSEKELLEGNRMELIEVVRNKIEDNQKTPLRSDLLEEMYIEFDLENFRNSQLIRLFLINNSLQTKDNLDNIGQQIEVDLKDEHEHGGIIVFDEKNQIIFKEVEQENISDKQYELPVSFRQGKNYIAEYHLHAIKEDCSEFNGPSTGGMALPDHGSDIENSRIQNIAHGSYHGVVITKLPGSKFNATYYSTVGKQKGKITKTAVCNIGDFEYSK